MGLWERLVPPAQAAEGQPGSDVNDGVESGHDEPRFNQAELDGVVQKRLAREKSKQEKALRDALGIGQDQDPLEAVTRLVQERGEADISLAKQGGDVSQVEARWKERLESVQTQASRARSEDRRRFEERLLDNEVRILLARLSDRLTADAGPLLAPQLKQRLRVDAESLTVVPVDDTGARAVDRSGAEVSTEDVMRGLLESYPSLIRAPGGGSGAHPGRSVGGSPVDQALSRAQSAPTRQNVETLVSAVLGRKPAPGG